MDTESIEDTKENILNINLLSDNLLSSTKISQGLVTFPHPTTTVTTTTNMILEKNLHSIFMEHCYSRPHTWRPETHFLRPTKTLFMLVKDRQSATTAMKGRRKSYNLIQDEDVIDVVSTEREKVISTYDVAKAKSLMDECERHAKFARVEEGDQAWEESVPKTGWTANQLRLFDKIVDILDAEYIARLSYKDSHNEPVIRRTLIEKTVKRFRWLMSTVSWDIRLSQWLHQVLTDYTSIPYLAIYLDMLQTLKSKLPTFTDRLMFGPNQLNRVGVTSTESLFPLLKRRWDPFASSPTTQPTTPPKQPLSKASAPNGPTGIAKRLPANAVIVVVPGSPTINNSGKRLAKWIALLNQLAPAYAVYANIGASGARMTIQTCLEQMFASTRAKVQEVKADHPNRNLILVGISGAGAALALQVAQVENVLCCVCIGFGLHTADGRRGQPDDQLMELQAPVLFVVGQCASTARQEEMEDLRERMRVETGLLMVGGADDYLRMSKKKRRAEAVTQSFVDRCVIEEIGNFASDILLSPYPPQMRQSPSHQTTATGAPSAGVGATAARNFGDHNRKRNNSNTSSLDSEPPSPLAHAQAPIGPPPPQKYARPVGRPPGSTSKARLNTSSASTNNKWANFNSQQQQGTPSPSQLTPAPPLATPTSSVSTPTSTTAPSKAVQPKGSPPPYPSTALPAVSQQPVKITPEKQQKTVLSSGGGVGAAGGGGGGVKSPTVSAKLQALANRGVMSHNIVNTPSGIRTIPPKSSIKVLNNITIATSVAPTPTPTTAKPLLHQQAFTLNPHQPPAHQQRLAKAVTTGGTTYGSLVLLPDGKLARSCGTSPVVKGLGGTPILFPLTASSSANAASVSSTSSSSVALTSVTSAPIVHYTSSVCAPAQAPNTVLNTTGVNRMRPKFITSKTQLITNRFLGQKQIKTIPYNIQTTSSTLTSTLPPPTNLTSQEIMDLPIIFADDDSTTNQILQSNNTSQTATNHILTIPSSKQSQGKLVIVNKPPQMSFNVLKRPASQSLQKPSPKYTKIILSKCPPTILNEEQKNKQVPIGASLQLPTDLSVRKEVVNSIKLEEPFDLEKELIATAVVKPSCGNVDPKRMTFIYKGDSNAEVQEHLSACTGADIKKMLEANENDEI